MKRGQTIYCTEKFKTFSIGGIRLSLIIYFSPVIFRWWQPGGYAFSFALNDVYIGPPCPENCNRQGTCENNRCICQDGFTGKY